MSLFYFQNNIIGEQFIKLNDLCNKFYDIYERICAESVRFSSDITSEDEISDGLKNNFSIISQMAERDHYNMQQITQVLDFIGENIYLYENQAADFQNSCSNNVFYDSLNENNEQSEQQIIEEQQMGEEQQNADEYSESDVAYEQQDFSDEQQIQENGFIDEQTASEYAASQDFADNVAESVGAVSADYNDTASVLDFNSDKNSEEIANLSHFSNDDFNNGILSVFGNSVKNSKSLIISLAVSGLSSVLAGGSFKFFRKNHNNNIEL